MRCQHDLSLFITNHHLHCRCNHREVEYKVMKMTLILPDSTRHLNVIATTTFFEQKAVAVEPTEGSILDLMTFNYYPSEDGTTPLSTFSGSEEIQHVGYDEEQCGRTK